VREAVDGRPGAIPGREGITPAEIGKWVGRKLLVRDFLRPQGRRFHRGQDEDVRKEHRRRLAEGGTART